MYIEGLEELDNKILEVIADDARLSYSDIAEKVGVSRVAVKNHMDAMEKNGVIQEYKTVINAQNAPEGRRFFIDIVATPDKYNAVLDKLANYNIIVRVYGTTGESRIHAEGYAVNQTRYDMFMSNLRRNMDGIRVIYIYDALCTYKDSERGVDYVHMKDEISGVDK